jgi:2-polyprenyl-6-methoxyphenol hydroxylase-like FAD-dependent oxidoreductase
VNFNPANERKHAIVIGGSMAGLLAARVLADRYERVTLVERDAFGTSAEPRRGVPQGRHTHGLLASGRQALEALLPGISMQLMAAGAVPGDIVRDTRWFLEGACHCRFASGLDGLLMSRPFLEGIVRQRVRQLPNVEFRDRQEISGLTASAENRRITGVVMGPELLAADLVVDTCGRSSRSPQWLEALGYPKPEEERVEIGLSYTSRCFRRHPGDLNGDVAVIIPPTPSGKRGGVMLAQEARRWTVTLMSHFGPGAPEDLEGFIEFSRSLPAPYIYELIRNAEPFGDPASFRYPASVRRRYEKLDRFPNGYLVMGDAISSFNPIYGQGMSVAALEALELQSVLAAEKDDLALRFFARAARVIDIPWSIAVGNDLRMPETKGPRTLPVRLVNAYMAKLHKAAHRDPAVALSFHKVGNLLAPPPSVLHPKIALRVLWANLRPRRATVPHVPALNANAALPR